jgi:capsular exopolysaccharide synthesis family protein
MWESNIQPYQTRAIQPLYQANKPAETEGARPIPYFQTLRANKWALLGCMILGAGLAAMAVWKSPYVYQARSLLEIQGINENLLNSRDVNPDARADNSSESYINTEARIMQTTPLLNGAAARLNSDRIVKKEPGPPYTEAEVRQSIRVRTRPEDRIVELWAESPSPLRAANIANAMGAESIDQDLESRFDTSRRTSTWLNAQLQDLGLKLGKSEEELQQFTQQNDLLIDSDAGGVQETGLREIQDELAHAQSDRMAKQAQVESLNAADRSPDRGVLADPTVQQSLTQLTALEREKADYEAIYTPAYYKLKRVNAEIAALQKSIAGQRKAAFEQVQDDLHAAQVREQLLQSQYASQFRVTADQTAKMVRYTALKSAVELNRTIYADILQKVKGYNVASAMRASNIRVIEPAAVPEKPSGPHKRLITVAGGLALLFVGACVILVRGAGRRSIQEPGEAQLYLRSPELGVIPSAKNDYLPSGTSRRQFRLNTDSDLATITSTPHFSAVSESFRSTSASLLLGRSVKGGPRVVLVTSLNASDGKTTVVSNLAISLAGISGRVLLIDGDRRRARLHRVFDRPNEKGLSEFLIGGSISQKNDFITDTPVPNLFFMPSGKTFLPTSDLLYSNRMSELIAACRKEFDMVLIDTPPVLHLPDARIIGRLSDGVILVLRAGRVRSETVVAAEQRLQNDGITVLGTVLNDWDPKTNGHGSYPQNYERVYQ